MSVLVARRVLALRDDADLDLVALTHQHVADPAAVRTHCLARRVVLLLENIPEVVRSEETNIFGASELDQILEPQSALCFEILTEEN